MNAALRHPAQWMTSRLTRRRGVASASDEPTSAHEVLDRLDRLRISTWTYGFDHKSVRHLGPTAQDFAHSFGLGSSVRHIAAVDANGVCMASIQALAARIRVLEAEMERLRTEAERIAAGDREVEGGSRR